MNDYNSILNRVLARVANTVDKRQGSVIFDTVTPSVFAMAEAHTALEIWKEQTYLLTATGINLDNRGADFSIPRFQATHSLRVGRTYNLDLELVDIAIGSRFATPNVRGGIVYEAIENLELGMFIFKCEITGTIGNEYYGDILPLFIGNNLGRAELTGTLQPARDIEEDEEYRERIIARMSAKAFGGNIADYQRFTKDIAGVGGVFVFPVWAGGGTVKLSVVDSVFDPITEDFKELIKETIDPVKNTGLGVGIAPIGHVVTVDTPSKLAVNVKAIIQLDGRTVGQVQAETEIVLYNYFLKVRQDWDDGKQTNISPAMIAATILGVPHIINVVEVKLNDKLTPLYFSRKPELQELPFLGVVLLYED